MSEDILHTTIDGDVMSPEGCEGNMLLIVNVASRCDLTLQYKQFENIHETLNKSGFNVQGLPCNQFMGQKPDNGVAINIFCSTTYGIAFPMFCKINMNEEHLHPRYQKLIADASEDVVPEKKWFLSTHDQ